MKENGEREREANVRGCSASEKKAQGWSFTFRPARTHTHTPLPDELPCFVTVVVLKWLCDGEKKKKTQNFADFGGWMGLRRTCVTNWPLTLYLPEMIGCRLHGNVSWLREALFLQSVRR